MEVAAALQTVTMTNNSFKNKWSLRKTRTKMDLPKIDQNKREKRR